MQTPNNNKKSSNDDNGDSGDEDESGDEGDEDMLTLSDDIDFSERD